MFNCSINFSIGSKLMVFNDKMLKATLENMSACWRLVANKNTLIYNKQNLIIFFKNVKIKVIWFVEVIFEF